MGKKTFDGEYDEEERREDEGLNAQSGRDITLGGSCDESCGVEADGNSTSKRLKVSSAEPVPGGVSIPPERVPAPVELNSSEVDDIIAATIEDAVSVPDCFGPVDIVPLQQSNFGPKPYSPTIRIPTSAAGDTAPFTSEPEFNAANPILGGSIPSRRERVVDIDEAHSVVSLDEAVLASPVLSTSSQCSSNTALYPAFISNPDNEQYDFSTTWGTTSNQKPNIGQEWSITASYPTPEAPLATLPVSATLPTVQVSPEIPGLPVGAHDALTAQTLKRPRLLEDDDEDHHQYHLQRRARVNAAIFPPNTSSHKHPQFSHVAALQNYKPQPSPLISIFSTLDPKARYYLSYCMYSGLHPQ